MATTSTTDLDLLREQARRVAHRFFCGTGAYDHHPNCDRLAEEMLTALRTLAEDVRARAAGRARDSRKRSEAARSDAAHSGDDRTESMWWGRADCAEVIENEINALPLAVKKEV